MAESQRFHIAVHMLMILAAKGADDAAHAMTSAAMAESVNVNPVVLRRVIAALSGARVVETRPGAHGGVWLARPPSQIRLDEVRRAAGDGPAVCRRDKVNHACPIAVAALDVIDDLSKRMEGAVEGALARLTLGDLAGALRPG